MSPPFLTRLEEIYIDGAGGFIPEDRDAHYSWVVGADEGGTIPFMRM